MASRRNAAANHQRGQRTPDRPGRPARVAGAQGKRVTARAHMDGHPVHHDGDSWRYADTGELAESGARPCARCDQPCELLEVPEPSWGGNGALTVERPIDACIADLLAAFARR